MGLNNRNKTHLCKIILLIVVASEEEVQITIIFQRVLKNSLVTVNTYLTQICISMSHYFYLLIKFHTTNTVILHNSNNIWRQMSKQHVSV